MMPIVSILGIPWDEQSSYRKGCVEGPSAIRKAFGCPSSNTWCESGIDLHEHPQVQDQGDVILGADPRINIECRVGELVKQDHRVLSLGGDHAITWPILRGFAKKFSRLNVLHLDAHPDLYDELDGNQFSHATPMARALEEGLIGRLVQVGIRTMNEHQQQQADRFDVEVVAMHQFDPNMKFDFQGPVYLSLDLDVLDPAFAPGVSHHEPGGFTTRELIGLIQRLDVDLVGADIVELNPSRDLQSVTAMTAAKLMKEVVSVVLSRQNVRKLGS